jgi:hypothetical protein
MSSGAWHAPDRSRHHTTLLSSPARDTTRNPQGHATALDGPAHCYAGRFRRCRSTSSRLLESARIVQPREWRPVTAFVAQIRTLHVVRGGGVWKSNPPFDSLRAESPALKAGKVTGPLSPPSLQVHHSTKSNGPMQLLKRSKKYEPGVLFFLRGMVATRSSKLTFSHRGSTTSRPEITSLSGCPLPFEV